jgi:hypothetical protein
MEYTTLHITEYQDLTRNVANVEHISLDSHVVYSFVK